MLNAIRRSGSLASAGAKLDRASRWRAVALVLLMVWTANASAGLPIRYVIRFPDAQNHYAEVEAQFPSQDQQSVELMMPVWTPGSYLVREYARHVEKIEAFDPQGKSLEMEKTKKNRWLVSQVESPTITVKYRLYCREMSVRTNWVEDKFAILNGAPTFITLADKLAHPHHVRLELPERWKLSITSLKQVADGEPHHYEAADFDELVDSPILCGNPVVYRFNVGQREHLLVNEGEGGLWDGTVSSREVAKIVAEQQRVWGVVPYQRFIFFNLITESRGGLEHDNSTLMMTSRWSFRNRESYLRWLGLVSHEFFHTWNVRRLRPRSLASYDYENENYTRSLWIVEGITSYYDNLSLVRAGVCSQEEYLKLLSKDIESVQLAPGRLGQSLRDSSYDTWIKFYRPDENSRNSQISYYTKGAVVAFLLDAKIREATADVKSLDHVMRLLYERHSADGGYAPDDFRAIAAEVAGQDLTDWFAVNVDSSQELDYRPALDWYGLRFGKPEKEKEEEDGEGADDDGDDEKGGGNDGETSDDDKADESDKPVAWLGITTRNADGRLVVSQVLRDSPAFQAGLNSEDEIVGIGSYRVAPAQWEPRLMQYQPGDKESLLIARREQLRRLSITFGTKPPPDQWQLSTATDATEVQGERLRAWLRN